MSGAVAACFAPSQPLLANWADVAGTGGGGFFDNADVTMMANATLKVSFNSHASLTVRWYKGGVNQGALSDDDQIVVAQGDAIHFSVRNSNTGTTNFTITNSTYNDELVDTFTYTFS